MRFGRKSDFFAPDQARVKSRLVFAMPVDHPFLLWKLAVENCSSQAIFIDKFELLSAGFVYQMRAGPRGSIRLFPVPARGQAAREPRRATRLLIS